MKLSPQFRLLIGLCKRLLILLDMPDSKEVTREILKICDIIDSTLEEKPKPVTREQLPMWVEGDTVYVRG